MKPGVFLDRDGVINEPIIRNARPYPPCNISELVIISGAKAAIEMIFQLGFEVVVVTNQPDISRGKTNASVVDEINHQISRETGIHHFRICPHDDSDQCKCRKPLPGLILNAATELEIDLSRSFLVGDRWRDIEAGNRAGCKCIFIDYGYDESKPQGDFVTVGSLMEAVAQIRSFYVGGH